MPNMIDCLGQTRSTLLNTILRVPGTHVSAHLLAMYDMRYIPRDETDEYAYTDCPCGWFRWETR